MLHVSQHKHGRARSVEELPSFTVARHGSVGPFPKTQFPIRLPYIAGDFQGAVFANRISPADAGIVYAEMQSLIATGCVANLKDVRGQAGPKRPRLIQEMSVEETKPRMIYAIRPPNQLCRRISYTMDAVERVADVVSEGRYQRSLDDSSAFHHILLHPAP